jgi:hypothetical protein
MRLKLLLVFSVLLISGLCQDLLAQGKRQREYSGFFDSYYYRGPITYTLGFNAAAYKGDLGSLGLSNLGFGASIGANYKVWPMVVLGAEFTYFTLNGKDKDSSRAISFTSTNMELLAYGRFYFLDQVVRISPDRKKERDINLVQPYVTTGVAFLMSTPSSTYTGSDSTLWPGVEQKSYPVYGPAFPVGLGVSLHPSYRLSFAIEATYRFTMTDYLDGVSKRGNPSNKDAYAFLGFKIQYSPSAPKKKHKMSLPPPTQYDGPKGTKTWKNTPREEKKKSNNYYEAPVEEGTQEEGTQEEGAQEESTEEQPAEEAPVEEGTQEQQPQEENNGW